VVHRHRQDRPHLNRGLVDDSKQSVTGTHLLHQRGLIAGHLQKVAGRKHHLDAADVRIDLAVLAWHGGVLGAATGRASHREAPDFGVHVELQILLLQFLRHIDVDRPGLRRHCIAGDFEDGIHLRHLDERAAIGGAAGRSGVVGADRADRRGILGGILEHGDDIVDRCGFDNHRGSRGNVSEPVRHGFRHMGAILSPKL
jgi:hypothetical protein